MNLQGPYRIIERWGEVHIQYQKRFLGLRWWGTVKRHYPEGTSEPVDFKTVGAAKAEIDRFRAIHHKIYEVPPVVTYYPA